MWDQTVIYPIMHCSPELSQGNKGSSSSSSSEINGPMIAMCLMEVENTQAALRCLWVSYWIVESRSDTSVSRSSMRLPITASLTCVWSTNNWKCTSAMFPKDSKRQRVQLYFLQHPHPLHRDLPGGFCTLCFWLWVILLRCLRSIFQQPCFGRTLSMNMQMMNVQKVPAQLAGLCCRLNEVVSRGRKDNN